MAVELLGHTLRLVLDGRVEVETEVGYALPWRLSKIHSCCDFCYDEYLWFCILIGLVEVKCIRCAQVFGHMLPLVLDRSLGVEVEMLGELCCTVAHKVSPKSRIRVACLFDECLGK
jgi:hypothetical protein